MPLTLRSTRRATAGFARFRTRVNSNVRKVIMKNIIAVFLLSEIHGGGDGANLAFEYEDASALPKLGEYVYFGTPEIKFQISAREHLFQSDETVRIIYRLKRPQSVDENEEACLRAKLIRLKDL